MSAPRTDVHKLQELVRLHRAGRAPREICRLLRLSPKTELKYRRALHAAGLLEGVSDALPTLETLRDAVETAHPPAEPRQVTSTTDPWLTELTQLLEEGANAQAAFDKLSREDPEFSASYDAVKRTFRRLRKQAGPKATDVAIPVVTAPGEVAQVDFGYVGRLFDPVSGKSRKTWVFAMTLGYSGLLYARLVFDQRADTWLDLHRRAFEFFGCSPRVLVPDNLKAAVIRAAFGSFDRHELELNRSYRELARFYGCLIDPTPTYAPQKKGKVEASVRYIKGNWWPTCQAEEIAEANADLARWLEETANCRMHRGTRERPRARFESDERQAMLALPGVRFEPVVWKKATVHPDSHCEFERRLYSVPWRLIGTRVWIRASDHSVEIYADDTRVATHERRGTERHCTNELHLPEGRRDLRHRSESYWLERADRLGEDVGAYVRAVRDSDEVLSKLRDIQAIVAHLEKFPKSRAVMAVRRAHAFGNYSYVGIKRILRDALDLQPLPTFVAPKHGRISQPRFARSASELMAQHDEGEHEPH